MQNKICMYSDCNMFNGTAARAKEIMRRAADLVDRPVLLSVDWAAKRFGAFEKVETAEEVKDAEDVAAVAADENFYFELDRGSVFESVALFGIFNGVPFQFGYQSGNREFFLFAGSDFDFYGFENALGLGFKDEIR